MAKRIIPASSPKLKLEDVQAIIAANKVTDKVVMVGIRGYYQDSMGKVGVNDRGIYDDAIFLVTPTVFMACNANVDPSAFRARIANLIPGVWRYKTGTHGLSHPVGSPRRYAAFVQADKVTVARDGHGHDTGFFGINIHRGGVNTTSSLGCQTLPPAQWTAFKETAYAELKRHGQKTFPYILTLNVEQKKVT